MSFMHFVLQLIMISMNPSKYENNSTYYMKTARLQCKHSESTIRFSNNSFIVISGITFTNLCLWLIAICSYNLGQNKKDQLTPLPPKAMMKARMNKNAPFWYHSNVGGGRGGPDVPFILSKIVDKWSLRLNICRFQSFCSLHFKYAVMFR